jgi:hypothetical protein
MVRMNVRRFRYERLHLLDRNRFSIALALDNSEVLIQSLSESNRDVELPTINQFVPSDVSTMISGTVYGSHQALEVSPFFSSKGHGE